MTFQDIQGKIFNRWYFVLLCGLLFILAFSPWLGQKKYQASVTAGLQINQMSQAQDPNQNRDSQLAYVNSFEQLSFYLSSRLSSIEIQDKIARAVGQSSTALNEKKPFYTVIVQGAGFVSLSYLADSEEVGKKFVEVVETEVYPQIVNEWNQVSSVNFKVKPMDKLSSVVVPIGKPTQLKVLPALAGLVLGTVVVVVLPSKTNEECGQSNQT
jgi:hypothetical protein